MYQGGFSTELEVWKPVKGYEGYYEVSNLGRVRSLDRYIDHINRWGTVQRRLQKGQIMSPSVTHDNYQSVALSKNNTSRDMSVHRLVATAFIPNPDNLPQVNHKDENPSNNCADNLEWCTAIYNNNYGTRNERLSKALKGKMHSEEYKQNMSQKRTGSGNPMYGRKQSAETRAKIGAAHKGKPKSAEAVAKMRESLKGHTPWNKGRHTRPIVCLDANIQFDCAEDAANWIGGVTPEAVDYVLKRKACCKGHVFVHADNIPEDIPAYVQECFENYRKGSKAGRPCRCIEDNRSFQFISEAATFYGLTHNIVWGKIHSGKAAKLSDGRVVHFESIPYDAL